MEWEKKFLEGGTEFDVSDIEKIKDVESSNGLRYLNCPFWHRN
jgi:hypothetical protein